MKYLLGQRYHYFAESIHHEPHGRRRQRIDPHIGRDQRNAPASCAENDTCKIADVCGLLEATVFQQNFGNPLMPEGPVILEENDEQPAVQNENKDLVQYL